MAIKILSQVNNTRDGSNNFHGLGFLLTIIM